MSVKNQLSLNVAQALLALHDPQLNMFVGLETGKMELKIIVVLRSPRCKRSNYVKFK